MATAVYSRFTLRWSSSPSTLSPSGSCISLPLTLTTIKNRTSTGAVGRDSGPAVAFPSLELPSAGSRGPGPHPVLRRPPPAPRVELYPSVELASQRSGVRHGELANVATADVRGRLALHGGAVGEKRQPLHGGRAGGGAHHRAIRPGGLGG